MAIEVLGNALPHYIAHTYLERDVQSAQEAMEQLEESNKDVLKGLATAKKTRESLENAKAHTDKARASPTGRFLYELLVKIVQVRAAMCGIVSRDGSEKASPSFRVVASGFQDLGETLDVRELGFQISDLECGVLEKRLLRVTPSLSE